jgi:hypothetical protein
MHAEYKPAKFHFSEPQLKKLVKGHKVRLQHHQIGTGPHTLFLHPVQHHKISLAHSKGKGTDLIVSDGEFHHTHHSGAQGTGVWDDIKAGFNKYVKPVLTTVGDTIANSLSYTNPQLAPVIQGIRGGIKDLTGVGLHKSRAHHAAHHAAPHAMHHPRKSGHHKVAHHKSHGNGLYL